ILGRAMLVGAFAWMAGNTLVVGADSGLLGNLVSSPGFFQSAARSEFLGALDSLPWAQFDASRLFQGPGFWLSAASAATIAIWMHGRGVRVEESSSEHEALRPETSERLP